VQDYYENLNQAGAYGVALMLCVLAIAVLVIMTKLKPKEGVA
jgi:ABC-type sulfate transport system permease subunit